jgi:hypothetical protein
MKSTLGIHTVGTTAEAKQDLRAQLAAYVAQQPASRQTFHKGMQIAEWLAVALIVAVFAVALYVSFNWASVPQVAIPTAWFCLPLSAALLAFLIGVHAIVLRAYPPTSLMGTQMRVYVPLAGKHGEPMPLQVGRDAVAWGCAFVVIALFDAVFFGLFAYAAWTVNMAILEPMIRILSTTLGIALVVAILYSVYRAIVRPS